MATNQNTKRKDKARVVLRKGESQRKDGKYDFRWTSPDGKRHSIYAATLEELREKENDIQRDSLEGIKAEARYVTLNDVFTLWAKVKRGLKDNTFQNYLYLYRQFVEPDFGKSKVSALKKSDVKQFYNTLADERGLRVGEATGLRWCDVDLEEGTISVNHTLVNYDHRENNGGRKGFYFNCHSPKTKAGIRIVPMMDFVKEA